MVFSDGFVIHLKEWVMPLGLIRDYLQTQGLKLPQDEVRVACMAVQTVMNIGKASIERAILWPQGEGWALADAFEVNEANERLLRQIFMALDSVYSRQPDVKSAAVYVKQPLNNGARLLRVTAQGEPLEAVWLLNDETAAVSLAARTALSGWLNVADDTARWLALGELSGARNELCGSQISAPVCMENGAVLGVVQVEYPEAGQTGEAAQTDWTALAVALAEPMQKLLGIEDKDDEEND